MIVEKNKVVTFTYELLLDDEKGERIQQVNKSRPLKIVVGRGNILEAFENKLIGLSEGDSFELLIKSDEAYGSYNPKAIAEFDRQEIVDSGDLEPDELQPGNFLPMETESGTPFNGKILEVTDEKVVLDFNHPLAGKDLLFKGKIHGIREATHFEIESGMVDSREGKEGKDIKRK